MSLQPVIGNSRLDIINDDGESHAYWSTHCRHGNCDACAATELAPGIPRRPAECKTCGAPCLCDCHQPSTGEPK